MPAMTNSHEQHVAHTVFAWSLSPSAGARGQLPRPPARTQESPRDAPRLVKWHPEVVGQATPLGGRVPRRRKCGTDAASHAPPPVVSSRCGMWLRSFPPSPSPRHGATWSLPTLSRRHCSGA